MSETRGQGLSGCAIAAIVGGVLILLATFLGCGALFLFGTVRYEAVPAGVEVETEPAPPPPGVPEAPTEEDR